MKTSNSAVQTSKTEAQKGFSLIELLVVVAIIGVLAAAGIVGYQSYLDGVKTDTHKNNAIALAKGLGTTAIARSSGLTVNPSGCQSGDAYACVQALATEGKFKSPILSTGATGNAYIVNSACASANAGKISVTSASGASAATVTIAACDKDGQVITADIPTVSFPN